MDLRSRFVAFPLSIRIFLVVLALLLFNQSFAVYLESAVAAQFGWPLLFFTALALVVVVLDGARRAVARLLG